MSTVSKKASRNRAKPSSEEENVEGQLAAHLAEYSALREELLARFESQRQSFNYLVIIISATISAIVLLTQLARYDLISLLTLFLPIVTAPLGFIFFDNELMLHANGFYVFRHLGKHISRLVGNDVLLLEIERFKSFSRPHWVVHRWLSVGRWSLFLSPTVLSMIYTIITTDMWKHFPFVFVFIIDCVLLIILIAGTISVLRINKIWTNLQRL